MKTKYLAPLSLIILVNSCVTGPQPIAKNVELEPSKGGIVMIAPSEDAVAHQLGEALMKRNCGNKTYQIVKEGDTKVGTAQKGSTQQKGQSVTGFFTSALGVSSNANTTSESATTDITEWRISYKCI